MTASVRPRADAVDRHVGTRIRQRRSLLGLSQESLGSALGVTFQQIQKYERGANRVGASRLWDLSRVLDVPLSYFYDEMPADLAEGDARRHPPEDPAARGRGAGEADPLTRRETLELVRAYYRVRDEDVRRRFRDMVRALAGRAGEEL